MSTVSTSRFSGRPEVIGNYLDPKHGSYADSVAGLMGRAAARELRLHLLWKTSRHDVSHLSPQIARTMLEEIRDSVAKYPIKSCFYDDETFGKSNRDKIRQQADGMKKSDSVVDHVTHRRFQAGRNRALPSTAGVWECDGALRACQHLLDRVEKRLPNTNQVTGNAGMDHWA